MEKKHDSRRSFLKYVLAGATVVAGTVAALRSSKAASGKPGNNVEQGLYRETAAFKKYYKTLRS